MWQAAACIPLNSVQMLVHQTRAIGRLHERQKAGCRSWATNVHSWVSASALVIPESHGIARGSDCRHSAIAALGAAWRRSMSMRGGAPNSRLYSRLNCDGLS